MVFTWGGPDLTSQHPTQTNGAIPSGSLQPKLPGFDRFMMERFSPLCWAMPTNPNFDSKDAQGRQVLGEAAGLQKAIYTKTGQDYLTWLRDVELNGMGMESGVVEEYLGALCNADMKGFQRFFQVCIPFAVDFVINCSDPRLESRSKEYQVICIWRGLAMHCRRNTKDGGLLSGMQSGALADPSIPQVTFEPFA